MRKMLKRLMSLALAACIILFAFSGCKKDDAQANNESNTKSTQSKTTAKTTRGQGASASPRSTAQAGTANASNNTGSNPNTTVDSASDGSKTETDVTTDGGQQVDEATSEVIESTTKIDDIDLKGRVLKISIWADSQIIQEKPDDPLKTTKYKRLKWTEEKFNCKYEWEILPSGTYNDILISMMMAGSCDYDICLLTKEKALGIFSAYKLIAPIDEYIDKEGPLWNDEYLGCKLNLFNGRLYGLYEADIGQPLGIWWRREMFQREGIPDIQDINPWTWNEFIEIAMRLTQDTNGDGIIDQWALATDPKSYLGEILFTTNAVEYITRDENGRFVVTIYKDRNAINALQFLSDLYNVYGVVTPLEQSTSSKWINLFKSGKAAMTVHYAWYGATWKNNGLTNLGWRHFPFGPDNKEGAYNILTGGNFYTFPATTDNIDVKVKVFLYTIGIWDDSMPYSMPYDQIASSVKQKIFYEERDHSALDYINARLVKNYAKIFPDLPTNVNNEIFMKVVNKETSISSAIESTKNLLQECVDAVQDKW